MPRSPDRAAAASPVGLALASGGYRSQDWRSRLAGAGGTAALCGLTLGCLLLGVRAVQAVTPSPAPLSVELLPLAAPPEPVREIPEGPERVEQQEQREERKQEQVALPTPIVPLPALPKLQLTTPVVQAAPSEAVPETSAPKALPAPPAPRAASDATPSWEAKLMAHLEKHRRYPAAARIRGEQGVAQVQFRMRRDGQVLALSVLRTSGSAALDRAALETIRRAQPLPAIPADKPDMLQLALPIEFFVRG